MFEPEPLNSNHSLSGDGISVEEVLLDTEVSDIHNTLEHGFRGGFGLKFLSIIVLLGLGVLSIRLYDLQIRKGGNYLLAAEENRIRYIQKFAPRGQILDRHGEVLARNIPNFELVAIPYDLPQYTPERIRLFESIAEITGQTVEEIQSKFEGVSNNFIEPVSVTESLTQEQALRLEAVIAENQFLSIQSVPIREYIDGPIFSNVLGYVGKLGRAEWESLKQSGYFFNDVIGKIGVELVYEDILRGVHGRTEVEVDVEGRLVKELRDIAPEAGENLTLTIDAGLQRVLYNSMEDILSKTARATGAAAVAINPKTGEVLALVTLPSYDNNLFAKGIKAEVYQSLLKNPRTPLLNRPLGGVYPPGSTIKPIVGLAALEEGIITDKTVIRDQGVIRVGSYAYYGWDRAGLGLMDIYKAIALSSDPFFYVIGGGHEMYGIEGLGVDKIAEYLGKFRLGSKVGINLQGEESGLVPTREWKKQRFAGTDEENWYLGNTYHLSIGQGYLLVTPLQLTVATAAIANNGIIYRPKLVLSESSQEIDRLPISQENFNIIKRAMRENVVSGSGIRLANLPVEVAGKTGTAQFDARDPSLTHAWYTGFVPYNDPELVITVLIESGGEGHAVAVPVVQEVLTWWAQNR